MKRTTDERWAALIVAAATFVVFGSLALARYRPLTYLVGDGPYYAETAVSLLHDHDLDLRNQLSGGLEVHGAQIALGRNGEWFPKHPILLAVLGLPFLALFGLPGLLLLNLILLATLAAAMFRLARHFAPASAAALSAGVLVVGTFLRAYAYNFSPDLLAALLATLAALALLEGRMAAGGLLLGTMVMAKPILVAFLLPAMAYALARGRLRAAARVVCGGLLPLAAFLLLDLTLFGSPFVTGYDRNVSSADGTLTITSHRARFDLDPIAGARGQILDPHHGLLTTAPVLLLAIPGLFALVRRRPAETLWLTGSAAALFAVLCFYRDWDQSHYGNRFLMPAVAFAAPAVAVGLEAVLRLVRSRAGAGHIPRALADGA